MLESEKSSSGIVEIEDVPNSPHTSLEQTVIYNPSDKDFTCNWDGKPYKVQAKSTASFPEFLANHIAKHLTEKILYSKVEEKLRVKIKELRRTGSFEPPEPDGGHALPKQDIQDMMAVILSGEKGLLEINEPEQEKPKEIVKPILTETEKKPEVKDDSKDLPKSPESTETPKIPLNYDNMNWNELRIAGKEKRIYEIGQTKVELLALLKQST